MFRIATATPNFYDSFKKYIPKLELFDYANIKEYGLVIFPGGEDIDPNIYGQRNNHSYGINTKRDDIEIKIYNACKSMRNMKMFGVCRGHQLILALSGCPLIQDIGLEHNDVHNSPHVLEFTNKFELTGTLAEVFPKVTNSLHHQAATVEMVNRTGAATIIASYKGIVEASVRNNRILTTQFHPEFMQGTQGFFDWLTSDFIHYGFDVFLEMNPKSSDEEDTFDNFMARQQERPRIGNTPRFATSVPVDWNDNPVRIAFDTITNDTEEQPDTDENPD
jgi:gamma-glutamyl-gamma-aminobutyrate hydrolase PuuD